MTKSQVSTRMMLAQAAYVLTYPALKLLNPKIPAKMLSAQFHIAVQGYLNGYSRENVDLLLQQARLESGAGFQNKATVENNNPFGMGWVQKRPTTQINYRLAKDGSQGKNTIGIYTSIASGVADRFLWDSFHSINPKDIQYVDKVLFYDYNSSSQYSFSWMNAEKSGLTVRKIHIAMIAMLVAGFIATQYLLKIKFFKK